MYIYIYIYIYNIAAWNKTLVTHIFTCGYTIPYL